MNNPIPKRRRFNGGKILMRFGALTVVTLAFLVSTVLLISGCASKPITAKEGPDGVQTIKVLVKHGYNPSHIQAKVGKPLKIEFYRDEEPGAESCDKDLEIPAENVKLPLPARESQIVEIKPQQPGEVIFQCGMNMMRGKITFQ